MVTVKIPYEEEIEQNQKALDGMLKISISKNR